MTLLIALGTLASLKDLEFSDDNHTTCDDTLNGWILCSVNYIFKAVKRGSRGGREGGG